MLISLNYLTTVFIGSVGSTTSLDKGSHYSEVTIISHIPTCKASIGTSHDATPTKDPGERVGVVSTCRLNAGQNYVFAGDMRHGYVADEHGNVADQLVLGCAQRDIDYALYFITKKLKCCPS